MVRNAVSTISNFYRSTIRSYSHQTLRLTLWAVGVFSLGQCTANAQSVIIRPQFEDAGPFHEGLAPVQVGKLWGFIDKTGKLVVAPRYDRVLSGSGGRFAIRENGLWGFIKTNGQIAVRPKYVDVKPFSDGVAAFRINDRWGYLGPNGNVDIEPKYFYAGQRYDGFHFIINDEGNFSLGTNLEQWEDFSGIKEASDFRDGVAAIEYSSGQFGLLILNDEPGSRESVGASSRGEFSEIGPFNEGLAPATKNGRTWGYIDRTANFVIAPSFKKARNFAEGFAPVQVGDAWGFVDRRGRLVVAPQFDNAFAPREGYALYRQGKLRGFLRVEGGSLVGAIPAQYEDAFAFQEGLAPVQRGGKWGYIDNGKSSGTLERDVVDLSPKAD